MGSFAAVFLLHLFLLVLLHQTAQSSPRSHEDDESSPESSSSSTTLDSDRKEAEELKAWVLGSISEKEHVALFQCYLADNVANKSNMQSRKTTLTTTMTEQDEEKARRNRCCDAIDRFPVHVLEQPSVAVRELCRRSLVTLPPTTAATTSATSVKLPLYSLLEVRRKTSSSSSSPEQGVDVGGEDSIQELVQQSSSSSSSWSWKHVLFDDENEQSVWFGGGGDDDADDDSKIKKKHILANFIAETGSSTPQRVLGASLSSENKNFTTNTGSSSSSTSFFHANLTSTLSESGGMHRELHHSIALEFPPPPQQQDSNGDSTTTKSPTRSWELDLLMLVYLPSDMFVNVQDAFEDLSSSSSPPKQQEAERSSNNNKLQLSLILVNDSVVIDEEQPEFSSPPHAFFVRIQGERTMITPSSTTTKTPSPSSSPSSTTTILQFSTKVHLRYPRPVSEKDHSFSRIVMLAPVLVAGSLTTRGGGGHSDHYQLAAPQQQQQQEGIDTTTSQEELGLYYLPVAPLVTWTSAGNEHDYYFVVLVTWTAAILGSLVMWRDISRIAVWK